MNRKERLVNFRITEEQYYVLRQRAAAEGVAVSEYVRSRLIRDEKAAALEARVSRLEMVVSPGELLAVAKGSM